MFGFIDEKWNLREVLNDTKRYIWIHSFNMLNKKYNESGGDMPFRYLCVSVAAFFVCLYYSIQYIYYGIRKNISYNEYINPQQKADNTIKSLFKGMEILTDNGINWMNLTIVVLLIIIAFQLIFIFYSRNHNNLTEINHIRTIDKSVSTKIEQQYIKPNPRYFGKQRSRYYV